MFINEAIATNKNKFILLTMDLLCTSYEK